MGKVEFELGADAYDFPEDYPSDDVAGKVTLTFYFDKTQSKEGEIVERLVDFCDYTLADEYGVIRMERTDG